MKIIPADNLAKLSLPLPLFDSVKLGEAVGKDGDSFDIFAGIDKEILQKLKKLSLDDADTNLQKNTSDRKRFGEGSYEDWYSKTRTPFVLIHSSTGALAALAWFGPKKLGLKSVKHLSEKEIKEERNFLDTENWHTVSFRSYPPFRGRGLMKDFANFALDIYMKSFPNARFWAGLNSENLASDKLALSLGFKPFEQASDLKANWLVMIRE